MSRKVVEGFTQYTHVHTVKTRASPLSLGEEGGSGPRSPRPLPSNKAAGRSPAGGASEARAQKVYSHIAQPKMSPGGPQPE